jgi:hypothetical protein
LANSKKNEIKKLENELKYLEELSNTSTYKEDTSLKQKLEIILVFSFQYPFPLLPLKSFSFKDILLWSVNFNTIGLMSLE